MRGKGTTDTGTHFVQSLSTEERCDIVHKKHMILINDLGIFSLSWIMYFVLSTKSHLFVPLIAALVAMLICITSVVPFPSSHRAPQSYSVFISLMSFIISLMIMSFIILLVVPDATVI